MRDSTLEEKMAVFAFFIILLVKANQKQNRFQSFVSGVLLSSEATDIYLEDINNMCM